MNTLLVPNTWNAIERVEYIAAVIKANFGYRRSSSCESELFPLELVVEMPLTLETLQLGQLRDANLGADGELFLIWLHRQRST